MTDAVPKSDRLRVNEIFHSLQGEADAVGYPTVFVRLTGCPLRCRYCDTEYAFHAGDWLGIEDIVGQVRGYGTQHVCVTGGEPLAQPNCLKLLERLCDHGFEVSLETSGALDIGPVDSRVSRVVDVKTPGSHEAARNRIENFEHALAARPAEIRDLLPRGLRLEQGVPAGTWIDRTMPDSVLTQLRASISHGVGGLDSGGPAACALPTAASQGIVGRHSRQVSAAAASAPSKRAIVLLSGGLDSSTVLAMARARGFECYALSVSYGQRHGAELKAARRVATALGAREHRVMEVDLAGIGGSALTDAALAIPESPTAGIPITYVPARNTLLLALALGWAEVVGAADIFIGVNAVDYSGYPDCRPEFIEGFAHLARLATKAGVEGARFNIQAPLISLSKADIIRAGSELGVDFSMTVSCYQAAADGAACARCDSCRLRAAGFAAAGIPDPTRYR